MQYPGDKGKALEFATVRTQTISGFFNARLTLLPFCQTSHTGTCYSAGALCLTNIRGSQVQLLTDKYIYVLNLPSPYGIKEM